MTKIRHYEITRFEYAEYIAVVLLIILTIFMALVLVNMVAVNGKVNRMYEDSYSSAILEDSNK